METSDSPREAKAFASQATLFKVVTLRFKAVRNHTQGFNGKDNDELNEGRINRKLQIKVDILQREQGSPHAQNQASGYKQKREERTAVPLATPRYLPHHFRRVPAMMVCASINMLVFQVLDCLSLCVVTVARGSGTCLRLRSHICVERQVDGISRHAKLGFWAPRKTRKLKLGKNVPTTLAPSIVPYLLFPWLRTCRHRRKVHL